MWHFAFSLNDCMILYHLNFFRGMGRGCLNNITGNVEHDFQWSTPLSVYTSFKFNLLLRKLININVLKHFDLLMHKN